MSNTVTEIGTIGQKYEDRKSGKSGVLTLRNEKYKTLELLADDGKSFNITFASFRSNWRKCKTDVVETESVVEPVETTETSVIDTVDTKVVEKKPKLKVVKTARFDSTDDEQVERYNSILGEIKYHIAEGDIHLTVSPRNKFGGIVIKENKTNLFEFWVLSNSGAIDIWMSNELFDSIEWSDDNTDFTTTKHIKGKLNITVHFREITNIDSILSDVLYGYKKLNTDKKESEVAE